MIAGVLAGVGPVLLFLVLLVARVSIASQDLEVSTAQTRDGDALAYVATYLVPFAAVTATSARARGAFALFVVLLAILYVRAELFYMNPLLAVVGYRLFQVQTPKGASVVLITSRRFVAADSTLKTRRLSDYVYWESRDERRR